MTDRRPVSLGDIFLRGETREKQYPFTQLFDRIAAQSSPRKFLLSLQEQVKYWIETKAVLLTLKVKIVVVS